LAAGFLTPTSHGKSELVIIRRFGQLEEHGMEQIGWEDFARVELRVGRVLTAEVFEAARKPAYVLQVDFGDEIGVRKSSAQITDLYRPEDLAGRLVVAVVNFPKKQIGPLMSECLVTGFHDADGRVALCVPDAEVPLGAKLA
jgi:tRNA-binding protein